MSDLYSDRPPLWKVMDQATMRPFSSCSEIYGAQLRAIAEEARRRYADNDPAISFIAWLEIEADRAEAQP